MLAEATGPEPSSGPTRHEAPPPSPPIVTIIVPAYNLAAYITDCLGSIEAQTFPGWECLVVDDGSTDATVAQVEAHTDPRIRLLRQANAGVSAARNAGLAQAGGEFVMFLDGDDKLHPAALERLAATLTQQPAASAAFGTLLKILDNGDPYPGQKPLAEHQYPTGDVLERMIEENFLANGGHVLIRTAAARAIGGFDTTLRLSEDWEFWCRLAAHGPFVFIGNTPEVFYLRMRFGTSLGLATNWDNHRASIDAVLGNPTLRARFAPAAWTSLTRRVQASHMWEAGRVNFTARRFAPARSLMLRSLLMHPRPKRIALFGLAALSRALNRPLVSRLRFIDEDRSAGAA